MYSRLHIGLIVCIAGASAAAPLRAGTLYWDGRGAPGSGSRYWGDPASWSTTEPNPTYTAASVVPNSNADIARTTNLTYADKNSILLADIDGEDTTYTIKSWYVGAPTSNRGSTSINNVSGGTAKLIMEADTGSASINAYASNAVTTFNVAVELRSNLLIAPGDFGSSASTNRFTFNRTISSVGDKSITKTGTKTVTFNAANTYSGGTTVSAGTLIVDTAGTLGGGDVVVSGTGILDIRNTAGAIADTAMLSIANDANPLTGVTLAAGINDTVGSLILDGVTQNPGTYGSTTSAATYRFDEYFTGDGIITVVPEPASMSLLMIGGMMMLRRRA